MKVFIINIVLLFVCIGVFAQDEQIQYSCSSRSMCLNFLEGDGSYYPANEGTYYPGVTYTFVLGSYFPYNDCLLQYESPKTEWVVTQIANGFGPQTIPTHEIIEYQDKGIRIKFNNPGVYEILYYAKRRHPNCPNTVVKGYVTIGPSEEREVLCPKANCDGLGLIQGGFEISTWEYSPWIRKIVNFDGTTKIYDNDNQALKDCERLAEDRHYDCLPFPDPSAEPEQTERCDEILDEDYEECKEQYGEFYYENSIYHEIISTPNPSSNNNYALLLGGSPLSELIINDTEINLAKREATEASIEQTFFVQDIGTPSIEIGYSWIVRSLADVSRQYGSESEITLALKEQPIISIQIFTFDTDGNDVEVWKYIETEEARSTTFPIDGSETIFLARKDWTILPIDLTPYVSQNIKLKITRHDRTYLEMVEGVDEETGETIEVESFARLYGNITTDITCSTCCIPSEDFAENAVSQSNGVVTITRPTLDCESYENPCTPTFLYQITSNKGEPYVISSSVNEVKFYPEQAGIYTVYYKNNRSCCWNETALTFTVEEVLPQERFKYANELKQSGIHCVPSFFMDSVLSVGATSFADRQFIMTQEVSQVDDNEQVITYLETSNPYLTGERGVWRSEGSYAYVTERLGTKDKVHSQDNDFVLSRVGGTFSLNMLNWKYRGVLPDNWRKVSEVSRYNPYTVATESRDILGRKSSALYGYNGYLSTAVCANAAYTEIAYEGFEDNSYTSNFDVQNSTRETDSSIKLKVLWAKGNTGVLEGFVPKENQTIILNADLIAYIIGSQDIFEVNGEELQVQVIRRNDETSWFTLIGSIPADLALEQWYGDIQITRVLPRLSTIDNTTASVQSTLGGHTGNKAFVVNGGNEVELLQSKLLLYSSEQYNISAWVKVDKEEKQLGTYKEVGISFSFYDNNGNVIGTSSLIKPDGNIIEGWQRIEGSINVPEETFFVSIKLKNLNVELAAYDDVRIYPSDGSMKTFVYDPISYLVQAVLDENNYASFYFYDEAERLHLTKKETREGVYTIQENHNHIKYRDND